MTIEKNKREKSIYGWLAWGICISLLASVLFTSLYGIFQNWSQDDVSNPIETEMNISWIYQNNYLLYRDLYNKMNHTNLGFDEIYLSSAKDVPWSGVSNTGLESGEDTDTPEDELYGDNTDIPYGEEYDEDTDNSDDELHAADGDEGNGYDEDFNTPSNESYDEYMIAMQRLNGDQEYLNSYLQELESGFSTLNMNYDYRIEDLDSMTYITNLPSYNIDMDDQYFYLSFLFDQDGNATVESNILGNDATSIRKYANEAIRNYSLYQILQNYDNAFENLNSLYYNISMPKNCRITYCISNESLAKMKKNGTFVIYGQNGYYYFDSEWRAFANSGFIGILELLTAVIFLLAFFLPAAGQGDAWKRYKLLRIPLEVLAALTVTIFVIGIELIMRMAYGVINGGLEEKIGFVGSLFAVRVLIYLFNIIILAAYFFYFWTAAACFRAIRAMGIKEYIKERCILYRIFPFVKSKIFGVYNAVSHFDVTKKANKLICKVVLFNAVILFVIGSLWMGGLMVAVVYSIILYIILRKYISDLQKKYGILLGAVNQIAEGDLNVVITEDLGVFEPFKPQIIRIQNGFSKAVDEEMKSQRMKSELITNVSHDLKTPLTAIITYVNLLKEENITEEQRKEYLDTLERKSLRLKVLIEDLFEVSKANSRNITLDIMNVDIINLIKQVSFEMSDKLEAAGLDVRMNLPEEKLVLPLDSQKTYRIYENLFGNIAKYALNGTRVYVDLFEKEDEVEIVLKNITAEEIFVSAEELTERFVRGDSSRNTEGSGLGLAIAKSFAELQSGRLVIQVDGDLFKVVTVWKKPQMVWTE